MGQGTVYNGANMWKDGKQGVYHPRKSGNRINTEAKGLGFYARLPLIRGDKYYSTPTKRLTNVKYNEMSPRVTQEV